MKKIINDPENIVKEMCHGIVLAHPELELDPKYMVIKKKNIDSSKVSLISGGGSGHEPAHAGFIGKGMLDAAVCGDVFASPSQIQVYHAIRKAATEQGVLLIIKNYSGDMMNFQNAARLAQEDGILVDYVKVDDDIAVQDSLYTVGRRGVAGTVFVHKIAGAAAEIGKSLAEVKTIAEKVVKNVKSIGFALSSCTVPAKGTPTFELTMNELEYGVGIHGEPGIRREKMSSASDLAKKMVESLCKELDISGSKSSKVAVLVNGFGASPLMELYLLNASVARELSSRGIKIARTFVGNYMTSIDMTGASISLLHLDDELEEYLNMYSDAPAFMVNGAVSQVEFFDLFDAVAVDKDGVKKVVNFGIESPKEDAKIGNKLNLKNMEYIVDVMSDSIIRNEVFFCELDSHAGDGDFGMSVATGFRQLKREWKGIVNRPDLNIGSFLEECSLIIMEYCGGASGPIWGSAFRAAGKSVNHKQELTTKDFAKMLQAAVLGIQKIGEQSFGRGAVVGDKTLIDALVPCADTWTELSNSESSFVKLFELGAEAAVRGAKSTVDIAARMGRAGTVGDRSIGYPDAGAEALGIIFTDIANSVENA